VAVAPIGSLPPLPAVAPATSKPAGSGEGFGTALAHVVDALERSQNEASGAAVQAAAGQGSVTDALIAATKASLETQVTTAVVNQATAAFNEIMNLPL
jgi:flagellar hook-basal body complex protein FliE